MAYDELYYRMKVLEETLRKNYFTRNDASNLISDHAAQINSMQQQLDFLSRQYNLAATETGIKFLTKEEYTSLINLQATFLVQINRLEELRVQVIGANTSFTEKIKTTFANNTKDIEDMKKRITEIESQLISISGQLGVIYAKVFGG